MRVMVEAVVRRGLSVEAPDIQAVIEAANAGFAGAVPDAFFRPYLASGLDVLGRMEHGTVLVATIDDRIIGTVTYFADANDEGMPAPMPSRTAGIRVTAVDPAWRGQGIGRRLVDACLARAARDGASAIALHTAAFMTDAVALYERAGFRRQPAFDWPTDAFFVGPTTTGITAMCFQRSIP
jgi:GNAT superfamily N-acetyltransferase